MDIEQSIAEKREKIEANHARITEIMGSTENSGLSDELSREMDHRLEESDQLMEEVVDLNQKQVAQQRAERMERQRQMLANTQFAVNVFHQGQPSGSRSDQPPSSGYSFETRGKNPRIEMPRHFGGLVVYNRGTQDLEAAFRVGRFFQATFGGDTRALQWCLENGVIKNQHVEGIDTAGGVLVPGEMSERIITLREQFGTYRPNTFIEPMMRDTKSIVRRKGGYKAYHTGELKKRPEQDPHLWDKVDLVARKIEVLTTTSLELEADVAINLADQLTEAAAEAYGQREDEDGWIGDATSEFGGISGVMYIIMDGNHDAGKVVAASGHTTFETLDMDDFTKVKATLPTYVSRRGGNRWYVSGYGFHSSMGRIAMAAGGNTAANVAEGYQAQFMGDPVEFVEVLPGVGDLAGKPMLAYGNLRLASTMGNRMEMTVRRSEHVLFMEDQIAHKWSERYDIVNHDLGNNSVAGPIVVLVGAAS